MADELMNNSLVNGAKDFLGHKYGPFPLGVWLVLIGGTAYATRKFLDRNKGVVQDNNATPTTSDDSGTAAQSSIPGFSGGSLGSSAAVGNPGDTGTYGSTVNSAPVDNSAWQANALNALVQLGYPAYTAGLALSTYLAGGTLSADQQATITAAIKAVGAPPNSVTPKPVTTTTPTVSPITLIINAVGATQPVDAGRTQARLNVRVTAAQAGKAVSPALYIQVSNSFTGNTWSDILNAKPIEVKTVNLAKGTNQIRAITSDRKSTSNVLTVKI